LKILDNIKEAIAKDLPFVLYNSPNSNVIKGFVQNNKELNSVHDYNESGFVFAPFDNQEDAVLIPTADSSFSAEEIPAEFLKGISEGENRFSVDESSKKVHEKLVSSGNQQIKEGYFEKVVLSRVEKIDLEVSINLIEIFKKLIKKYKTAFVYAWHHPKVGTWMGATPETLVAVNNESFITMSLAGTKEFNEHKEVVWTAKEIHEQNIVTDFISNELSQVSKNLIIADLETIQIGNLLHLRTMISGEMRTNIGRLIHALHPTPAVCGFPKKQAKDFILNEEKYDRSFYTGFLGELNLGGESNNVVESNLYVNLRCMQLLADTEAHVYVGGGITKDSNPENEWFETVAKSNAMKSVL
jgi:isochorismate synthase